MKVQNIQYGIRPDNYAVVDRTLSRSAQPDANGFLWLKRQGVTDVIDFKTLNEPQVLPGEDMLAKKTGLKYHKIPTVTYEPKETLVKQFLELVENIKKELLFQQLNQS